jgi:regulator of protease activity HflC (stomatin/prohibitin superfamily)
MKHENDMTQTPNCWLNVKAWLAERKIRLIAWGLVTSLALLLLWPHIVVSVYSGEVGVLYSRLFGGTVMDRVYKEGLHLILPWDVMYVYDTRLQQQSVEIPVLSRGGLTVVIKASIYFYPIIERLPELQRDIGPLYKEKLILPIVTSAIRNTVGGYWPEDLYTSAPLKLQDEIMVQAVEQMARKPVIIDSLVVGSTILPQLVNEAIDLKFSAEQEYLRYKYVLLKAGEQLKERYIQAESIRLFQETVNKGLTENFLRWSGIEATKELAASPNAKFVVVGGRDGLPLILNTEPPGTQPGQKPAAPTEAPGPAAKAAEPQSGEMPDWKALTDRFKDVQEALKKYGGVVQQNILGFSQAPAKLPGEDK